MKKRLFTILTLISTLLSAPSFAQDLNVAHPKLERIGENIEITFEMEIDRFSSDYRYVLTTVLWNDTLSIDLKPIVAHGRNKRISEVRKSVINSDYTPATTKLMSSYKIVVPYRQWMSNVSLSLERVMVGYNKTLKYPTLLLLHNQLPQPAPILASPIFTDDVKLSYNKEFERKYSDYVFMSPISEHVKTQSEFSDLEEYKSLKLYFEKSVTKLDGFYKNNYRSLNQIKEALSIIDSTEDIELSKIIIYGSSSPEGMFSFNERIGLQRAESVVEFISKYTGFEGIEIINLAEDWSELRVMVAQSNITDKDKVLWIIDNYSVFEGREKKLIELNGGTTYRHLLAEYFPKLRSAGYMQLFYDVKANEDFINSTRAVELIKQKKYQVALDLLTQIQQTPFRDNLIGVCYQSMGDNDSAKEHFVRAMNEGDTDALNNMLNLEKYESEYTKWENKLTH